MLCNWLDVQGEPGSLLARPRRLELVLFFRRGPNFIFQAKPSRNLIPKAIVPLAVKSGDDDMFYQTEKEVLQSFSWACQAQEVLIRS